MNGTEIFWKLVSKISVNLLKSFFWKFGNTGNFLIHLTSPLSLVSLAAGYRVFTKIYRLASIGHYWHSICFFASHNWEISNSEEQLPSTDSRPSVGRLSVDCRPTDGCQLVYWSCCSQLNGLVQKGRKWLF